MAKTRSELFALINANVPDNTSGLVTPAGVREVLTQTADSMSYAAFGFKEVEVLRASSIINQNPSAADTPLQVVFGAAQGSASDPVMVNAAGLVTFNVAGNYAVRVKLQQGRTGSSGTSILFTRILLNGVQIGSPQAAKMENPNSIVSSESRVVLNPTAGQTFTAQIMRDSSGNNSGGLVAQAATVTAWGTAPSALIVISRLEAVAST